MLNKLSSTYFILQGAGLYSRSIKKVEEGIQGTLKKVNELTGNIIAIIISKIYAVMTIGVFDTVSFWYHNHSCAMKTLSFLSMSCHLCDVERNDKDQSKPVVKHSNLSNNSEHHMVVCCLSVNLANSKSHQTLLQKKYLFASALKIHMASIYAFHSINLFLCFPWYHVSTNSIPLFFSM